jgi:hypothetical protein
MEVEMKTVQGFAVVIVLLVARNAFGQPSVLVFPQFVAGMGMYSEVELISPYGYVATGTIETVSASGEPIRLAGGRTAVEFGIAGYGRYGHRFEASGTVLHTGWLRVRSSAPIVGTLRFVLPGLGMTAIESSPLATRIIIPVRYDRGGINTGVAIVNPSSSSLLNPVLLQLRDDDSQVAARGTTLMGANTQMSYFLDELFPDIDWSSISSWRGTLSISATTAVGATALEMGSRPGELLAMPATPAR